MKIKNLFFIFIVVLTSNCSNNEPKYKLLEEKIDINFENGRIIVLSEYDCINCLKRVRQVIEESSKMNLNILYYVSSSKFLNTYPTNLIKEYSFITSKKIDGRTFSLISELSSKKSSPFLLIIENNHITDIISFTKLP